MQMQSEQHSGNNWRLSVLLKDTLPLVAFGEPSRHPVNIPYTATVIWHKHTKGFHSDDPYNDL